MKFSLQNQVNLTLSRICIDIAFIEVFRLRMIQTSFASMTVGFTCSDGSAGKAYKARSGRLTPTLVSRQADMESFILYLANNINH